MHYDLAHDFMIERLEEGLPDYITYHNLQHTKDVIKAVEILSERENVTGDDLILVKTAALFHDAGFLQHYKRHEELSCKIARKYLPQFQYTEQQIDAVCSMISSTKLPQSPSDRLSRILCDADLYYLGGDDYEYFSSNLYKELKHNGMIKGLIEWELRQIEFLKNHRFFTDSAVKEREPVKQKHLEKLKSKLESTIMTAHNHKHGNFILDFLMILGGVILAGIALKGFLVPNKFFDGGITGMSLLVHKIYNFNLAIAIILLNIPLIAVSYFSVGKHFAYKALLAVIMLGICLVLLPDFALTSDKLLISLFGGVILGVGTGLVMRAGAALDGIEVLAIYTLKRTSFTISEIILGINILIFSIAAFKYGIETALYSVLTYFAATRSIDYVVEGLEAYTGVTIITGKSETIKFQLVNELGRGITIYKGERGFLPGSFEVSKECDIIFTVITRLELRKLKNLVSEIDPKAFVYASTIKEASGGIVKRVVRH